MVVATRNPHKLEELGEILAGFTLEPLPESVVLPPEDGETFTDNALIKALRGHGHDAIIAPLYLPMVTDLDDMGGGAPVSVSRRSAFESRSAPAEPMS